MLSGSRDEVVPKEQMRELWEIVENRQGAKTSEGAGQVQSKFIEFEWGTHSEHFFQYLFTIHEADMNVDDTCVQEGYWTAVAEFVSSFANKSSKSML